ncbi:MAG: GTPase Era [Gammaproteobacteria bacterium]|nr:GTPase Era [Gammaproteobacteria bacterium]
MNEQASRCGFAAIVGRPNVGKSTLLNKILGQKISIVTPKPQTTRHRIIGVHIARQTQILFVDTPGIQIQSRRAIDSVMNRNAQQSIADADVLLFVTEYGKWKDGDEHVLNMLRQSNQPVIAVLNKCDTAASKVALLPHLQALSERHDFLALFPASAKSGENLNQLIDYIADYLPVGPWLFPADAETDKDSKFRCAEIIREKLMMELQEEIPYGLTVEIESWEDDSGRVAVAAIIWCEKESQKPIIIGKQGERLKRVGTAARKEVKRMLGLPVHLQLWAKTRRNWADSMQSLRSLGYEST